ncbi:MAG: head decoration protein [Alphaproteobacteria bacterium]|nr:head decoration protein [Alphaproteobacteria bacterium]
MTIIVNQLNGGLSVQSVTITLQNLLAGSVLGRRLVGASAAAVAFNNTGNGTPGAITVGGAAKLGRYRLTVFGVNPATFSVIDPEGVFVGIGTAGVPFTGGGLTFTLSNGGAAFVGGDGFSITVSGGSFKYLAYHPNAATGEQTPAGVLLANTDATGGDQVANVFTSSGVLNFDDLVWSANVPRLDDKVAALAVLSARTGIFFTRT